MKFYQTKILKIVMSLIALAIIFKYSFLIFLFGVGLIAYLNKKNVKFKSFSKTSKIILSSVLILFTFLIIGIKSSPTTNKTTASSSSVETATESTNSSDKSSKQQESEIKNDSKPEVKDESTVADSEPNEDKTKSVDNSSASAALSPTTSSDNSTKSSGNTSSTSSNNNTTSANNGDENTIVYYVPGSNVYHLSKSDGTLSRSKNIQEITLKDAKAKGMQQSKSKADN
ncbi:hypothetical protein [uncultured Clostridium sp.]|uniref:hypothetical protein n=1 Tax=uncultured Clostridium sp. TaxID=59620 RepID=UPI0028E31733|nr:hypothetical protein [uncultured Clostridium sp.]